MLDKKQMQEIQDLKLRGYTKSEILAYYKEQGVKPPKGSFNQLPEHRKGESEGWMEIAERLRGKWNCYDFQHFINGIKKETPRHIAKQLGAVEQFLDAENPDRSLVAEVLKICCKKFRYQFSQFRVVYEYTKAGRSLVGTEGMSVALGNPPVDYKQMDTYRQAFEARIVRTGKEVQA